MILLTELATKLENILNSQEGFTNPTPYLFRVATEGFHIDHIADKDEKKNFIPVFIGSMGGTHNPVPQLKQASQTVSVVMYYPVRFKNDFYNLYDFLVTVFVGTSLYYGDISGRAISNMSVPQYGELQNLDFKEFETWVEQNYQRKIDVMETYMSMQFTLYFSTASGEFLWGNAQTSSLSIYDGDTLLEDSDVAYVTSNIQSNSEPSAEQELGTNEGSGIPTGTSYGAGFSVYVKNTPFYKYVIEQWFAGNSSDLVFDLTMAIKISDSESWTFTRKCYLQSANLVVTKGQLITLTFSFGKILEINEEE